MTAVSRSKSVRRSARSSARPSSKGSRSARRSAGPAARSPSTRKPKGRARLTSAASTIPTTPTTTDQATAGVARPIAAPSTVTPTTPLAAMLPLYVEDSRGARVVEIPDPREQFAAAYQKISPGARVFAITTGRVVVVDMPSGWKPSGPSDIPPNVTIYEQGRAEAFANRFNELELADVASGNDPSGRWAIAVDAAPVQSLAGGEGAPGAPGAIGASGAPGGSADSSPPASPTTAKPSAGSIAKPAAGSVTAAAKPRRRKAG